MGVPSEGGIVSGPDASGEDARVEARTEEEGTLSGGVERSAAEMSSTVTGSAFLAVVLAFAAGNLERGKAVLGVAFVTGENDLAVAYVLDESLYALSPSQSRLAARRLAILDAEKRRRCRWKGCVVVACHRGLLTLVTRA